MHEPRRTLAALAKAAAEGRTARAGGSWVDEEFIRYATRHRLAGVIFPVVETSTELRTRWHRRVVADELWFRGTRSVLESVDGLLAEARVPAAVVKGHLLAERLYPRPAARPVVDIDLLVARDDLERAAVALAPLGYRRNHSAFDEWSVEHHQHLILRHESLPPVELHFLLHAGFAGRLRAETFLARSRPARTLRHLRVLSPEDELVYLAVHAGAHAFSQLGWLFDIKLLLDRTPDLDVQQAQATAREHHATMALGAAAYLLAAHFPGTRDVMPERISALRLATIGRLVDAADRHELSETVFTAHIFAVNALLCDDLERAASFLAKKVGGDLPRRLRL